MQLIQSEYLKVILWLQNGLLIFLGYTACKALLKSLPARKRRVRYRIGSTEANAKTKTPPEFLLKILLIRLHAERLEERRQLLVGAGLRVDVLRYEMLKRLGLLICMAIGAWGYAGRFQPAYTIYVPGVYLILLSAIGLVLFFSDKTVLEALKRQRSFRIVKEVYVISSQLLYYSGSTMNLHGKLQRCLPFAKAVRWDLQRLLNEWYQDAGEALAAFRTRLGTDEGHSFAETLNSLRLYEHEAYYALLKQRVADYKERLALVKESRKETASYLLFVLAGMPVMNTFRIFIYPWVQEGQKLFSTLN